jgi:hypothetical protein
MAFVNKRITNEWANNEMVTIDEERGFILNDVGTNRDNCTEFDFYWPGYGRPMRVHAYGKRENLYPDDPLINVTWTIGRAIIPPKLMPIRTEVFDVFLEALRAYGMNNGRWITNNITINLDPDFKERVYGISGSHKPVTAL